MIIICGHKWTQNQRKTLKISGKKCIFTNNRLKITGFETFISIGYLSAILIAPTGIILAQCRADWGSHLTIKIIQCVQLSPGSYNIS